MKATKPLKDKREGACARGPCRMPRRCWNYDNCYLYAATGGEAKGAR